MKNDAVDEDGWWLWMVGLMGETGELRTGFLYVKREKEKGKKKKGKGRGNQEIIYSRRRRIDLGGKKDKVH